MAKSGLKITGDKKLDRKLRHMEKKVGKKLLRNAMRQTAKEFQTAWMSLGALEPATDGRVKTDW